MQFWRPLKYAWENSTTKDTAIGPMVPKEMKYNLYHGDLFSEHKNKLNMSSAEILPNKQSKTN